MLFALAAFVSAGFAADCAGIDLDPSARHCRTLDWNARNANGDGYIQWCDGAKSQLFLLQNRPHTAWGGVCKDDPSIGAFDGDHAKANECVCKYCLNRDLHSFPINPGWMSWPRDCAGVMFYCRDHGCPGNMEQKDGTTPDTECPGMNDCRETCCQPKTYCNSYTCVGDRERKDGWNGNEDCKGDCNAKCCQDKTFCSSFDCKRGQTKIAGSDRVDCAGDCQANCCEGEPVMCHGYDLDPVNAKVCETKDWNRRNLNGDGYLQQCDGGTNLFLLQNRPHTAWGGKCRDGAIGAFDGDHFKAEECVCTFCLNRAHFGWPINPNWANWPRDCSWTKVPCSTHTCAAGTVQREGTDGDTDCGPDCQKMCCQEPVIPVYTCEELPDKKGLCTNENCEFKKGRGEGKGCVTKEGGGVMTGAEFCAPLRARKLCDGYDQCLYDASDRQNRKCITTDGLTQAELCEKRIGKRKCLVPGDDTCAYNLYTRKCILAADDNCGNYVKKGQCQNLAKCVNGVACQFVRGECVDGGSC